MVSAIALLIAAIAGGFASTYLYDRDVPLRTRLAAGTVTSFAALSLIGFILAMMLGLGVAAVLGAATVVATPILVFGVSSIRDALRGDVGRAIAWLQATRRRPGAVIGLLATIAVGWLLVSVMARTMIVREGAIYTGVTHNYGDLPFHLTVVSRFVAGNNLPPEHPSFAGAAFTYPFLTDFLSAMLVAAGADLWTAIVVPSTLGALALVLLLHQWTFELTDDALAAWVAPALLLLGGGLGWWILAQEMWMAPDNASAMLARLPHDYSIRKSGLRFGNVITTLLIPQRGINLGLPMAVVVFRQWWLTLRDTSPTTSSMPRMLAAGLVAGMLPLVHGHSYLVVMGMAGCQMLLFRAWRAGMTFLITAVVIGAPQLLFLARGSSVDSSSFVGWAFGWDRGNVDPVVFWLANTGALIPILILALVARGKFELIPSSLRRFYLPFLLCFLVPNLVRLAPWVWDNIKVLVYWFLASTPVASLVLSRWYRAGRWLRAVAVSVAISLTAAGVLDLWRVWSRTTEYQVFDATALDFARLIASVTDADSTILHAPTHNHSVFLSGRRSFVGYPGHLWSQGLDSTSRERDLQTMYGGGPEAATLLARHHIDYVVIGVDERPFKVNEAFFARFPLVAQRGPYRLYRITLPTE